MTGPSRGRDPGRSPGNEPQPSMPIKSPLRKRMVTFSGRKKHLKGQLSQPRPLYGILGLRGDYLPERQGCLPNITTTLLPRSGWCP